MTDESFFRWSIRVSFFLWNCDPIVEEFRIEVPILPSLCGKQVWGAVGYIEILSENLINTFVISMRAATSSSSLRQLQALGRHLSRIETPRLVVMESAFAYNREKMDHVFNV